MSLSNDSFISWLFAWIWISALAIPIGRACSLYFPYLVTGKIFFTIKNEKLRRFFISTYLNRDNSNATNPKDQDKLPLLGCIYYAVAIPLVTVAYIALISCLVYFPFPDGLGSMHPVPHNSQYRDCDKSVIFWLNSYDSEFEMKDLITYEEAVNEVIYFLQNDDVSANLSWEPD